MCSSSSGRGEEGHEAHTAGIKLGAAWKVETNAKEPWARNGKRRVA